MGIVRVLRDLWRLRALVAVAAVLAVLAAIAVPYLARYEVGIATTSILVDTPSSQVVAVAPKGSNTLGSRAHLIANLMVDGVVKQAIARRAGLRPSDLKGTAQNDAGGGTSQSDAADGQTWSQPSGRGANVLTTRVPQDANGGQLPIIAISAQAPKPAGATRLANAAVSGLRDYLNSQGATERVPEAHRLRVTGLGPAQAGHVTRGPTNVVALLVALCVFMAGCVGILAVLALVRAWRATPEDDHAPDPANGDATVAANGDTTVAANGDSPLPRNGEALVLDDGDARLPASDAGEDHPEVFDEDVLEIFEADDATPVPANGDVSGDGDAPVPANGDAPRPANGDGPRPANGDGPLSGNGATAPVPPSTQGKWTSY